MGQNGLPHRNIDGRTDIDGHSRLGDFEISIESPIRTFVLASYFLNVPMHGAASLLIS
jgi:hypothetical protein